MYFPKQTYVRTCIIGIALILCPFARSQDSINASKKEDNAAVEQPAAPLPPSLAKPNKRIFGVLPNYRTIDEAVPFTPLTPKQKFTIAAKDTFDYPVYFLSAGFAGLYQLDNQNPSYGQGLKGYAKRFGAAYGDQAIGNILAEGVFPTLLREDTRYFRRGEGTAWQRTRYALSRVFVSRTDKGTWGFNFAEWLGNGSAVAISNLYYPDDTRNVGDNVQKLGVQVATDAFSNVLKEFWPDWRKKFLKKRD